MVMTDDQGCDQSATYVCDTVHHGMPWLSSLPGGSWYVGTQVRYHTALCCPGRASIYSGQTSVHNGQFNNETKSFSYDEWMPTAFQRAGYATGIFGKLFNFHNKPGAPNGWDRSVIHDGGGSYYNHKLFVDGVPLEVPKVDGDEMQTYQPYYMRDQLLSWLEEQHEGGKPWLATLAAFAPHTPGEAAPDVSSAELSAPPNLPNWKEGCPGATDPSIEDKPSFIQQADCKVNDRKVGLGALAGLDNAMEDIYDYLVTTGQVDNTIIVFLGDNGVALGAHRLSAKQCAYVACASNPLMIRVPGWPGGEIDRLVSNLDVLPTLLELTRASTTLAMDGVSLVPLLNGDTSGWRTSQWEHHGNPRTPAPDDFDTIRQDCVVMDPCYQYTRYVNGERELYEMRSDPFQLTNRLENPTTGYEGSVDASDPVVVALDDELDERIAAGV
jgi:arylsulfatase A-like enzyme